MLRISQTGIRDGELITSSSSGKNQCGGALIRVHGYYPPSSEQVDALTYVQLRDALSQYPFFEPMSVEERKAWLEENAKPGEIYLNEVDNIYIEFVKFSGKFFYEKLTQDQIDMLIAGNSDHPKGWWNIKTVYHMIPAPGAVKGKRHTLIFRPSNWMVTSAAEPCKKEYTGRYIDMEKRSVHAGTVKNKSAYVIELSDKSSLACVF